ncbi:MAG TPA: hypothetical protein VK277_06710 [Acidimicrobiales bacterium]|nr:hypothetical protein [Acidimicrobiales bacterium]
MAEPLYADRLITLTDEGIEIDRYYCFVGAKKRIPWHRVRSVEVRDLTPTTGRYRIWGTSRPGYWFNDDGDRPHKSKALVLDIGAHVKPVLTPDDPDAVLAVIEAKRPAA